MDVNEIEVFVKIQKKIFLGGGVGGGGGVDGGGSGWGVRVDVKKFFFGGGGGLGGVFGGGGVGVGLGGQSGCDEELKFL